MILVSNSWRMYLIGLAVSLAIFGVVYFTVIDPVVAAVNVQDYRSAVGQVAQTSLRSIIGKSDLDDLLSNRERLCLRLHYADGLDIGRIGTLYKIHRSTVARRLAEYRRKLRESVQERLRKRLKLTDSEYQSILSLVRSQMVVSLRSALKNPANPA